MSTTEPSTDELTPQRAFVVQFRAGAGDRSGTLQGRVEHVTTGLCARFESLQELGEFFATTLRSMDG